MTRTERIIRAASYAALVLAAIGLAVYGGHYYGAW